MTGPVLCCYRCLAPLQGGSASGTTSNNCRNAFDHGLLFHAACVGDQCPLCPADATARHAVNLLGASALAKVAYSAANGAPADAAGQGGLDPAFLQEVQRLARAHDESDDKQVGTVGLSGRRNEEGSPPLDTDIPLGHSVLREGRYCDCRTICPSQFQGICRTFMRCTRVDNDALVRRDIYALRCDRRRQRGCSCGRAVHARQSASPCRPPPTAASWLRRWTRWLP